MKKEASLWFVSYRKLSGTGTGNTEKDPSDLLAPCKKSRGEEDFQTPERTRRNLKKKGERHGRGKSLPRDANSVTQQKIGKTEKGSGKKRKASQVPTEERIKGGKNTLKC